MDINKVKIFRSYLLFVFGKIDAITNDFIKDVIADLNPHNELKDYKLPNGHVYHFIVSVNYDDLERFIKITLEEQKISNFYFLIEHSNNLTVKLPNQTSENFLTLDLLNIELLQIDEQEILDDFELIRMLNYLDSEEEDDEDDEEYFQKYTKKVNLSLDTILEKINEFGINSLTQHELNYLKTY